MPVQESVMPTQLHATGSRRKNNCLMLVRDGHGYIHHAQQCENKCLHETHEQSQDHERNRNKIRYKAAKNAKYSVVRRHVHCDTNCECDRSKDRTQAFNTHEEGLERKKWNGDDD